MASAIGATHLDGRGKHKPYPWSAVTYSGSSKLGQPSEPEPMIVISIAFIIAFKLTLVKKLNKHM